jgi:hypothetical protein
LANQLETFSRQQSGFVAPTSDADARRAQAVQSLNVGGAAANESDVKKLFALQQAAMNRDAMDKPPS